ncbi:MAG TPA: DUF1572 family protein [Gemmatimonadales bacterium]|jgi:hypothetical protein|nr:DUF1572 family protein [Gemmatimonadales bacterium]
MMNSIRAVLVRELEAFAREIDLYPDDTLLWETVPGILNSSGVLGLHVAGNLQHFIGSVLGNTGYVRDRAAEFARRSGTRAEVIAELTRARQVVISVLGRLPDDSLTQTFPERKANQDISTALMLLHLATHLAFHLGQAGYLRRALTGDSTSAGGLSSASLVTIAAPKP